MNTPIHINYTPVDFDPFAGPAIELLAPLTEPQTELWLACKFGGDDANRAYNESISVRLHGSLDRAAFEWALGALVERHQAFRSAFSGNGKTMLVFRSVAVPLAYDDLTQQPSTEHQAVINNYLSTDAQHIFDLENGPLVKTRLLKLSETEHFFSLTAHHIVCDGWSMGIALQDLATFYSARTQGKIPALPPVEQIGPYAIEQLAFEQTADYKSIEQFWLDQYRDSIPVVDLPTDFPRPPRRTYASHRKDFHLDDDLTLGLRKLGQRAGCSFVSTLLVSFEVLLHRLTGQTDLVVGLPASGQSATGHQRLVGHCVNLLPIKSHIEPNQSFIDYLKSRRDPILDAFDNQRITFGSLLKKLAVPRDPARVPLVPVLFNVDFGMDEGVDFHGLTFDFASNPREFETVDLFVNAGGTQKSLTIEWSYNTQLFRAETIDKFMEQFAGLLREVLADPAQRVSVHPSGRGVDKEPITTTSPATPANAIALAETLDTPLHYLLAQTATQFSDKPALEFNGQTLTYEQLHTQANHLAHHIQQRGMGPGTIVGVMLDRTPEMVVSLLAVLKAGAAYLPLDPVYPHDRLAFMLTDSAAGLLITSTRYAGRLNIPVPELLVENVLYEPNQATFSAPGLRVTGDTLAYILYTSGSTGKPKGVLVEHRNVVNFLIAMVQYPGMAPSDKLLAVSTISFDIAGLELFLPLLVGGTLVLADAETTIDGRLLLTALRQPGISLIQATPATYKMLLTAGWNDHLPVKVLCCGEPLSYDLAQKITARSASLWNMYGPTETTIFSTIKQVLATDKVITIGRPILNTRVYIVDEQQRPVSPGTEGEILIGGEGVARGYLNRPELTAEKFIQTSFDSGTLYRTGDLGKLMADGEILCLGRIDQQVKIRGFRIELGEIENTLNKFSDIQEAVVISREDRPGDQRLVAYVVADTATATQADSSQWKQLARQSLPEYMVPASFVVVPMFPLTPNGKIDRKALAQKSINGHAAHPAPAKNLGAEEAMLMGIWSEVLGDEKIGLQDSFFDLGGHSMLALQVMTQLEKETGRRLPLATLFECPTIESLAHLLRADKPSTAMNSLVPINPLGSKMPVYIVHGGGLNLLTFKGLIDYMDVEQPIYGFQARGLDGSEEPLDDMNAIAADYIEELLEHNPDGPYALAGYSFGGYIALETARQLLAQGKTVKMLGMFDTNAEESTEGKPFLDRLAWRIGRQVPKMIWIGQSLIKQPMPTLRYQGEYVERQVKNVLKAVGLAEEQTYSEIQDENLLRIIEKHETAFQNYQMRPYNGVIDVFKAQKRLYFVEDRDFLGWKKYALQGVRVHDIPGDHKEMLLPPNDKEFARILQQALDQS